MQLSLPYGTIAELVTLPDELLVERIGRTAGRESDLAAILPHTVAHPVDCAPFKEFTGSTDELLIIINDATRATPSGQILFGLREQLARIGRLRVLVATGLHRAPTEDEYRVILGPSSENLREVSSAHDGHDLAELVKVDGDERPILVNPALPHADRILVINSVEPHFFAGYTGGRKSFLPGLAGYASVEASHAGAVDLRAAPLRVVDNPVRDFISRNTRFLDPAKVFAIQLILERSDKIVRVFAGNIDTTFRLACAAADKFYTMRVVRRYDIVLALVRPPLDINLYQTEKAWEHARAALKPGGILICVSACREGVGSRFYEELVGKYPAHHQWAGLAGEPYEMGLHKLVRTARMREQGELWLVSELADSIALKFWYEPKHSIQTALDEAINTRGPDCSLLIIDDAALTVPVFGE